MPKGFLATTMTKKSCNGMRFQSRKVTQPQLLRAMLGQFAVHLKCLSSNFANGRKTKYGNGLRKKPKAIRSLQCRSEKFWHFGTLDGIKNIFNDIIDGDIQRVPITERDVRYDDGAVVSLLLQALVRAIADKRDLNTDGRRVLWKKEKYTTEREGTETVRCSSRRTSFSASNRWTDVCCT